MPGGICIGDASIHFVFVNKVMGRGFQSGIVGEVIRVSRRRVAVVAGVVNRDIFNSLSPSGAVICLVTQLLLDFRLDHLL